jgi:Putative beta barrel porin-7 (BBP7)
MNRARLSLVLLVLGTTAATAPAQYYPGYPNYGPQPPTNGAFPAYGMPIDPVAVMPNTMVTTGAFVATPPPAANGFSTPLTSQAPLIEPPYIPRIWAGADYVAMWVKRAPVPVPLVTKGSDSDAIPGALGQPGTMVVEGNSRTDFDTISAAHVFAGIWLDCDRCIGIEGSAFATENAIHRAGVASDATGNPPLFVPFGTGTPRTIADPASGAVGSATVTSTFEFRGAEINGILSLERTECCEVNLIAGARYLRLAESLNFETDSTNTLSSIKTSTFDGFSTRDEFYGGQLGGRVSFRGDRLFLDTTATVAVGPTYQTLLVAGNTNTFSGGSFLGSTPGGVLTTPPNLRSSTHNQISVVPELQLKLGLNLSSNLTVFAAYNYLYWTDVIRPGNQMAFPPATSATPLFTRSDFWAQGVSFGMEIKF